MSTIVLPTNGQDYNAPVDISFGAGGILDDSFSTPIGVWGGASGYIDFSYSADVGGYSGKLRTGPEPDD